MPARYPQCQGQAFLLPIFCGDKILLPGIDHLPCTAAPIKRTRPGLHGGVISRLLAPNVPADEAVVESLVRVAFKTVRITGPSSALDTAAITEILQRDYSNMIRRSSAGTSKEAPLSVAPSSSTAKGKGQRTKCKEQRAKGKRQRAKGKGIAQRAKGKGQQNHCKSRAPAPRPCCARTPPHHGRRRGEKLPARPAWPWQ